MTDKARNTRALIKKAARTEFAEHGFAGARVARIAAAAGVNKQLIFYYFQSKSGIFEAVVSSAQEELATAAKSAGGGDEQFRKAFSGLFQSLASSDELTKLLFFGTGANDSPRKETMEIFVTILSNSISRGQSLGHYRDDVDPDFVARQAIVILVGYFALAGSLYSEPVHDRSVWLKATTSMLGSWLSW